MPAIAVKLSEKLSNRFISFIELLLSMRQFRRCSWGSWCLHNPAQVYLFKRNESKLCEYLRGAYRVVRINPSLFSAIFHDIQYFHCDSIWILHRNDVFTLEKETWQVFVILVEFLF